MSTSSPHVIHIGYHKTGSSWFQKQLFPRVRNARFVARAEIRRSLLLPSPFAFDPDVARAQLLVGREDRLLLSEEELSGNLHTGGLHGGLSKEIAGRLHRSFPDARIAVFVRNQTTMIASSYKQYIKGGGSRNIRGFLEPSKAPHKIPNFSLDYLAYDGLIGHYESLFGSKNVRVFAYEDFCREPLDFLKRFADALDLDFELPPVARENAGLRSGTLALMRVLNHFHDREIPNSPSLLHVPGLYRLLRSIAPRLDRLPFMGTVKELPDYLSADEIAAIEDRYRESNERLAQRHDLALADFGYPLPRSSE